MDPGLRAGWRPDFPATTLSNAVWVKDVERPSRFHWLTLILCTTAAVGLAMGGVWLALERAATATDEALAAAHARWATRPFARYRLVTELATESGKVCRQDTEVYREQVMAVFQNSCSDSLRTVTTLFTAIETYTSMPPCQTTCACSGPIFVHAVYDDQWGFAKEINAWLRPEGRWFNPAYWKYRLTRTGCFVTGFDDEKITVLSLTPLPDPQDARQ